MRMRGVDICRVWSRVPGLNDYWCQQIQWRISKDDELIGALTEPRYPCPDDSLDTIILTQTVYLCQLFLHLQEFDPCATDTADSTAPNDELLCVFQDSLAREFNYAYGTQPADRRDGPAPVGEALERLVRGLMLAQRQEPAPPPIAVPPPPSSPAEANRAQLHALLIRILRELNEPVDKNPIRYEQAYGPRRDDTWAARFATRVMQWRWTVRFGPAALIDEVIEVQRHDVHPLDDEGLEVYRILRCTAPGLIHIVTPLHPETMQPQPQPPPPPPPPPGQYASGQSQPPPPHHRPGSSSGMRVERMLGTPQARTPVSSHSDGGSDTPRTTPQFPPPGAASTRSGRSTDENSSISSGVKRCSEDLGAMPPASKRSRSTTEGTAMARAAMAMTDELAIRGAVAAPMDIDEDGEAAVAPALRSGTTAAALEENNALLRRTLQGVVELGRKIDGMQAAMDLRLKGLDDKLGRIFEWVESEN